MLNEEYKVVDPVISSVVEESENPHRIKVSAPKLARIHRFMIDISPYSHNDSNEESQVKVEEKEEDIKPIMESEKDVELPFGNISENKPVFDEHELKERLADKYKNLGKLEKKEEKKAVEEKKNVTEADFEKLLSFPVSTPESIERQTMYREMYNERQSRKRNAKLEQSKLADLFQNLSVEEQKIKSGIEETNKILEDMKNKNLFGYLVHSNEESEVSDAASLVNESLQNYYRVNMQEYEKLTATLNEIQNNKNEVNKSEEQVRLEIKLSSEELNKFMNDKAPILERINKHDEEDKEIEKMITKDDRAEYEEIKAKKEEYYANEQAAMMNTVETQEIPVAVENSIPEINTAPVDMNEPMMSNAMENFKRVTAVQSNGEQVMGIENGVESQVFGGRVA